MDNLILIGMPGAGKSTIGVLLAKELLYSFMDTDLLIQERESRALQTIIDSDGLKNFLIKEEEALLSVNVKKTVIATGGSAVYSQSGITHLKKNGITIYIDLPFSEINRRINNMSSRGIAMPGGMTLFDLYNERVPLYKKYADITADCSGIDIEKSVKLIISKLEAHKTFL